MPGLADLASAQTGFLEQQSPDAGYENDFEVPSTRPAALRARTE